MTALSHPVKQGFAWKKYLCLSFLYMSSITLAILLLPNRLNLLFLLLVTIGIIGSVVHCRRCLFSMGGIVILAFFCFALSDLEHCRFTSWIYTCGIICTISYFRFMLQEQYITCEDFLSSLRSLVYIFGIAIVIQFICHMASLPVFNTINQSEYFVYSIQNESMRLASLTYEPAHYAKIIAICLFCHLVISKNRYDGSMIDILKKNSIFYGIGFLQMLCAQSSSGIVLCGLAFLGCFSKKNFILLSLLLCVVFYLTLSWFGDNVYVERLVHIWDGISTFDVDTIVNADPSGGVRIAPYIIYLQEFNILDWRFWFGHGFDASVIYFADIVNGYRDYIPNGVGLGGFFVTMLYNYGILFTVLLLLWIKKCCFQPAKILYMLFYFLVCYDMGFNTYIVCFATLVFVGINYFSQEKQKKEPQIGEISK